MKWTIRATILCLLVVLYKYLDSIKHHAYVFDPTELHALAQAAIAASPDSTAGRVDYILANLTSSYSESPARINTDLSEWVFNNAGGAMGAMHIIHASLTEYLIIFGTPLGTEGHTGVNPFDNYFHILSGEQWAFEAGELEMRRYPTGSQHFTPRGVVKQYKMHEGCWALEYSRGWIPLSLPFGFADALTSTLDFPTLYRTVHYTAREMLGNLLNGKI